MRYVVRISSDEICYNNSLKKTEMVIGRRESFQRLNQHCFRLIKNQIKKEQENENFFTFHPAIEWFCSAIVSISHVKKTVEEEDGHD